MNQFKKVNLNTYVVELNISSFVQDLKTNPGEGNGNPFQYSCLENSMDGGAWQAIVHRVARVGQELATKPPPRLLIRLGNKKYSLKAL